MLRNSPPQLFRFERTCSSFRAKVLLSLKSLAISRPTRSRLLAHGASTALMLTVRWSPASTTSVSTRATSPRPYSLAAALSTSS
ncbi:hypothetical protein D3C72_1283630 [compost metagenome]